MRSFWVIYRRPIDFPDSEYVMREHVIDKGETTPTENFIIGKTLEEMRAQVPPGAVRMERSPKDEPQIVEWYMERLNDQQGRIHRGAAKRPNQPD